LLKYTDKQKDREKMSNILSVIMHSLEANDRFESRILQQK